MKPEEVPLNKMSLGELWIGLFEYYAMFFPVDQIAVSVRSRGGLTKAHKKWNVRHLCVEGAAESPFMRPDPRRGLDH